MNELIRIENNKAILKKEMIANIIDIETKIKELTDVYDTYKKQIQEEMEKRNIIKLVDETTGLSISYVAAQENLEKFNKTRLRDNYPDIYDECVDMNGKRAAYITIRK